MQYISHYESPLGAITLAADEKGLTGLWFDGEKYFGNTLEAEYEEKENGISCKAENIIMTPGGKFGIKRNRHSEESGKMAGYVFYGTVSGEKASAPLTGDRISKSGLGNSFKYSLRTDGNLW